MDRDQVTGSKFGITAVVMTAALMAMIDITIVNVALSDIRASFGTPIDQIGWVSTGYMMANVVIIPMTGWFQRRFGFRRYFVTSILIFGPPRQRLRALESARAAEHRVIRAWLDTPSRSLR